MREAKKRWELKGYKKGMSEAALLRALMKNQPKPTFKMRLRSTYWTFRDTISYRSISQQAGNLRRGIGQQIASLRRG